MLALGLERKADSEQIFFVGNSYTFFWNLPQTVQAMARIQNRSMEVQQSTASGASLEQHWSFGFCCATKSVSTQFLSPRGIQIPTSLGNLHCRHLKSPACNLVSGFPWHARKGEKGLQTVQRLRSDSFDCLVLQERLGLHSGVSSSSPQTVSTTCRG